MCLRPIGVVSSPCKSLEEAPRQGLKRVDVSRIFLDEEFEGALRSEERRRGDGDE